MNEQTTINPIIWLTTHWWWFIPLMVWGTSIAVGIASSAINYWWYGIVNQERVPRNKVGIKIGMWYGPFDPVTKDYEIKDGGEHLFFRHFFGGGVFITCSLAACALIKFLPLLGLSLAGFVGFTYLMRGLVKGTKKLKSISEALSTHKEDKDAHKG